ncbi:MAG: hypothetical protein QNJ98_03465 [Planctomycetota bacterium]|nr:hypothetical protein [Planctomycetota bacterium]
MPVEFALWGLVLLGATMLTMKVAGLRLDEGGGGFLFVVALVFLLGVMILSSITVTHIKGRDDTQTSMLIQTIVCAAGWLALFVGLAGIRREGEGR